MTKALKSKTTRRAARPVKQPGDVVSLLLAQQRRLLHAMSVLKKKGGDAAAAGHEGDAPWYGQMESAVFDRASVALDELSFMRPKIRDGAVFTLAAAYASLSGLNSIQDPDFRERRRRRSFRLLYSLLHYLVGDGLTGINPGDRPGDNLNRIVRFYMPPWENPHRDLEGGRSFATAGNAEGDGAAS